MKDYTITCTACGSFERGIAYRDDRIGHTHTWTGKTPAGQVRIVVTA